MLQVLEFEKHIAELELRIEDLRQLSDNDGVNIVQEITKLQKKADALLKESYGKLTPWQKVLVARHPQRPHALEYITALIEDFTPLAGDRLYGEDAAIVGGLGRFRGQSVVIMGQEKGHDTETRMHHNFGMANPEGYRKSQRLMKMADQFGLPIITLVDTAGAYPGLGAEERGQAEAIAKSMEVSLQVGVPILTVVIGEGGSGGAIALATANYIAMLEHAIYAVISPEGCASILWRSSDQKQEAAAAQKFTAQDLKKFKLIDEIIPEPLGGAHRDVKKAATAVSKALHQSLTQLYGLSPERLRYDRREKFLKMGRTL